MGGLYGVAAFMTRTLRCGQEQSGINGLLPTLRMGPFHLFRLPLDLRSDVLKEVTVTFREEKWASTFCSEAAQRIGRAASGC
jgi:hypothetical protein